jgi:DNA-binding NarL/FixJ family response regulator
MQVHLARVGSSGDNGGVGRSPASRTVAIVDDHEMFAEALRAWARDTLADAQVVYAGADPSLVPHGTHLVLLDIDLGEQARSAEHITAELVARGSAVLLVSALGDASRIRPALAAGALGYVPKKAAGAVLLEAVEAALSGETYVSPDLAAVMMAGPDRPDLSVQESTALRLYASGLKLDAVARRMNVSSSTAREYLARVRRKYATVGRDVRTKTDLYAAAVKDGLIDPQ